jgi:hypothetical protein
MKIFLKISILPTPSPQFDIYDSIVSTVNISASIHHSLKRKSPLKSSQNNLDFEGIKCRQNMHYTTDYAEYGE